MITDFFLFLYHQVKSLSKISEDVYKRQGFENALYGVYAKMGTAGLYGQNLSYYALDLMAQYYTSANNEEAEPLIQYDYKSTKVEDRFYNIWCEM